MPRLNSIKVKVILVGILLCVATSGIVATALYQRSKSELVELQSRQHAGAAARLAAQFDHDLGTLQGTLTRIAQSIDVRALHDPTRLQTMLVDRPALEALFPGGFVVVDAQGNTVAEMPDMGRRGANVSSREWFRQVSAGRPIIGEPYFGGVTQRPLFVMAAPLGGGAFEGAIVATIYLDEQNFFSETFQADRQADRESRRISVVSRASRLILASSDPADSMRPAPDAGRNGMTDMHMSGHESVVIAISPKGVEELVAARPLSTAPWTVVVATATAVAFKPVNLTLQHAVLWGVLGALLAATVFWMLTSRLLAPAEAASRLIRRQLEDASPGTEPLPAGGNDEIGMLLDGFNRLQGRIRTTANQLASILDNSTVGITFVKDRRQLWANRRMAELFGYSMEEMAGQSTRMFYPSQEAFEAFGKEAYSVLLTGGRFVKELMMGRKDGSQCWTRISGRQVDPADPAAGSIWILEDISDRRQAETALRESEAKLRIIADNTYDWEYWRAPDGQILYMSPSCERITGYPVEEFMADPELLSRIVAPEDQHVFADHLHEIGGKNLCDIEFRIRTKAGETCWIAHGCRPIHGPDGQYLGRRGSNRDVTAAKAAELEYRTIVQTAQDGFIVVGKDTRFLDTNDAYCRMMGYHRDEILAMKVADVEVDEDHAEVLRHTEEIHRTGHAQFETRHRRKDGSIIDVEVTAQQMNLYGGVLIVFIRNVTQRKFMEAELERHRQSLERLVDERTRELAKAKEAAEAANVVKTAFLANMGHELRTPLHQVRAMAELVCREPLTARQADRMEKLESASVRLTRIIDTILDLTNLETRQFSLVEAPVDIPALVRETATRAQAPADARQLRLIVEAVPLPAPLLGDMHHLKMALNNYVTNAIRFTQAGSVTIRARLAGEDSTSSLIRFEVEDTGIGISAEDQGRLFNIFEQADNSTTRRYGGLGAGLAMTRKIAQLMGGDAGCDSRPGVGSLFWFTVRLKKAARAA